MKISSLPTQTLKRLSELVEDLIDILNKEASIIKSSEIEVDRMEEIKSIQDKLDSKGSEFDNISTPMDAKELHELIIKSDELSKEKSEINIKSKLLYEDLDELTLIKNNLKEEINKILKGNEIKKENDQVGIYVDSLNTNVYIIDGPLPNEIDKISPGLNEIINCNVELIKEISEIYNNNVNVILADKDEIYFEELKEKVEKYKTNKNNSEDKQLELLKKTIENENVINTDLQDEKNEEEKIVLENTAPIESEEVNTPKIDEISIINENPIIENVSPVSDVTNEIKEEPIVPISNFIENPQNNVINNAPSEVSTIYVDFNDKVVPNQIARATKDKLNNKIIPILSDSFVKTKIDSIAKENNVNAPFSIEGFVNNQAA